MDGGLIKYRAVQRRICLHRDEFYCVRCWQLSHILTPAVDVHHVYGRGRSIDSPKESYKNLLSLCRDCHIIIDPQKGSECVVRMLEEANEKPINKLFEHKHIQI